MALLRKCTQGMFQNSSSVLDMTAICEILPHRLPALRANRIFEFEGSRYGMYSPREFDFAGHFPGDPVLPAYIIMESSAQLGCCEVVLRNWPGKRVNVFAAEYNIRMKRPVRPGSLLLVSFEEIGEPKSSHGRFVFTGQMSAWADGILIATISVDGSIQVEP